MILKSITCPACGGRNFTLEEVVDDDELTGVDLNCARGCGFYTYEAGDRSAWNGLTIDLTAQSSAPQSSQAQHPSTGGHRDHHTQRISSDR